MAGIRRSTKTAAPSWFVSLVSELGSPLTRSEKLDRDPWLDRLDRLEVKLDARFDEVKKLLQELFGNSREEAGVEEEEEEEIAIDKAEKEEEDEATVVIEEKEEEEEESDMEQASDLKINQSEPAAAAVPHGSGGDDEKPAPPAPSVGCFEFFRVADGPCERWSLVADISCEVSPDALGHLLRPSLRLEIHGMSSFLLHKQLALQCSSGVCKNVLKRLGLQIAVEMGMTMEVGDDGLPMPPPRPPPEPPPEPPPL